MTAAILTIGTELTRGEIENRNAQWLCERFAEAGVSVDALETLPDTPSRIAESLTRLGAQHDWIVSTGGLGPTTDDVTSASVAMALGVELVRDATSENAIRERYRDRGVAFPESSAKQADFPAGSVICPNDWGTAPGFSVKLEKARAFFLPGVPREMRPMFERYIVPELATATTDYTAQVRLRTFGAPESRVNELLTGVESAFGVTLGYRAHFPEIDVKAIAVRATRSEAEAAARRAADAVAERLGDRVFGEGETELSQAAGQHLRAKGWTLGLAESCTGGLVASLVTQASCSDYFRGGIVCYANDIKTRWLNVSPQALATHGAVSEVVVRQMALGARETLGADVALAISGIAGPTGASNDKPLGLVHYAVATPEQVVAKHRVFAGDRQQVQRLAAFAGLDLIRRCCI